MNYIVSDFIIRLKNAVLARRKEVIFPCAGITKAIAQVLVKEGFLAEVKEEEREGRRVLVGKVNYIKRTPQFTNVRVISKPSLRTYARNKKMTVLNRGLGITVLSTNQGIMTGREALQKGIGGEVLFKIW